ncbi:hypothetical protein Tco_1389674 [Tanacetum coccineum]
MEILPMSTSNSTTRHVADTLLPRDCHADATSTATLASGPHLLTWMPCGGCESEVAEPMIGTRLLDPRFLEGHAAAYEWLKWNNTAIQRRVRKGSFAIYEIMRVISG